jgi:transposase
MQEELFTMSTREHELSTVISKVLEGQLSQRDAAKRVNLSTRQVRRLCRAYKAYGPIGLVSKRRGKPSKRKLSQSFKASCLSLIRQHYYDYGPTLASEKLWEYHCNPPL